MEQSGTHIKKGVCPLERVVVFGGSGFIGSHVADELTCDCLRNREHRFGAPHRDDPGDAPPGGGRGVSPREDARHHPETPCAYQPAHAVTVTPTHQVELGQGLLEIWNECGGSEAATLSGETGHDRDGRFGGWGLMAPEWSSGLAWLCDSVNIAARGWARGTEAGTPNRHLRGNCPGDHGR